MRWKFFVSLAFIFLCTFLGISYYKRVCYAPYLTVIGFANMSDGIGRQSVEIMDAMKDYVSVGFRPTSSSDYKDVPPSIQKIMKKKRSKLGKILIYEDLFYPLSYQFFQRKFDLKRKDQIRFAYSMFESSQIPKLWVHNLNLYFDAVIVPDEYHIQVYQDSGVTLPIFVLPLGLNLKPLLDEPIKIAAHSPFVFANFSTCISRKNHADLIQAFYEAFGDSPDVTLWINCKYSRENLFNVLKKQIQDLGVHNILLTDHCYDNPTYIQNFHKIDCYVSLAQSEGFSIQPREAMAMGIPCILSDNTAQSTVCKSGLVTPISCPIQEIAYYEHFQDICGWRAGVDKEKAVKALKDMYHRYHDHILNAQQRRLWASHYDYAELRPLYLSLIKPKKVLLGKENSLHKDLLITNSPSLYEKYKNL
jgi:hypothetical protein